MTVTRTHADAVDTRTHAQPSPRLALLRLPDDACFVRCSQSFGLFGSLLVIGYATHGLILVVAPFLAVFYYFLQRKYRRSSRELKRLDSVSRSPVYVFGLCSCSASQVPPAPHH